MSAEERQRVVRVAGRRRAQLTPAPGTQPEPAAEPDADASVAPGSEGAAGPNDERMRRDVPPHY